MLSLLLMLAGCGGSTPSPPAPERPPAPEGAPSIVVVLCDTLRADALGTYGATRANVSPSVDAFAAESVVFEHAVAPNAWTVPSVASIFTASWPLTHGVLRFRGDEDVALERLPEELPTLAEHLHSQGYDTAALLKTGVITADHGFAQGFDHFEVVPGAGPSGASGPELTTAAAAWLSKRGDSDRPHFLYLHYMDPHSPYQPPPGAPAWGLDASSELKGEHSDVVAFKKGEAQPTPGDLARLHGLYDAEVHTFDAAFGDLLKVVSNTNTIVVLVADHGEQFGEHGGWLHEHLWPENIHIPFIVRAPGLDARRVPGAVSSIDLAPTVVELAGLPPEPRWTQATSRVPQLRGAAAGDRDVFSEYGTQRAVFADQHMLLSRPEGVELFDQAAGPASLVPVLAETLREPLLERLNAHIHESRSAGQTLTGREVVPLDEEHREVLIKLGYLDE